jgi:hypothetical protein
MFFFGRGCDSNDGYGAGHGSRESEGGRGGVSTIKAQDVCMICICIARTCCPTKHPIHVYASHHAHDCRDGGDDEMGEGFIIPVYSPELARHRRRLGGVVSSGLAG